MNDVLQKITDRIEMRKKSADTYASYGDKIMWMLHKSLAVELEWVIDIINKEDE